MKQKIEIYKEKIKKLRKKKKQNNIKIDKEILSNKNKILTYQEFSKN